MYVVWDTKKANSNLKKHGDDFADAAVALEDENALTVVDLEQGELRFKTIAMSPSTNVLFIVHTEQDEETLRIISARNADREEQRQYFEGDFHE